MKLSKLILLSFLCAGCSFLEESKEEKTPEVVNEPVQNEEGSIAFALPDEFVKDATKAVVTLEEVSSATSDDGQVATTGPESLKQQEEHKQVKVIEDFENDNKVEFLNLRLTSYILKVEIFNGDKVTFHGKTSVTIEAGHNFVEIRLTQTGSLTVVINKEGDAPQCLPFEAPIGLSCTAEAGELCKVVDGKTIRKQFTNGCEKHHYMQEDCGFKMCEDTVIVPGDICPMPEGQGPMICTQIAGEVCKIVNGKQVKLQFTDGCQLAHYENKCGFKSCDNMPVLPIDVPLLDANDANSIKTVGTPFVAPGSEYSKQHFVNFSGANYVLHFHTDESGKYVIDIVQFDESVSQNDRKKWVNNQYSDGLYADAPSPINSFKLSHEYFEVAPGPATDLKFDGVTQSCQSVTLSYSVKKYSDSKVRISAFDSGVLKDFAVVNCVSK